MIAPKVFVSIFISDSDIVETATWGIRIFMGTSCILGAQTACQQTFLALGNAKTSLFLAMLRKIFLLLPLILLLPHFFENKVFGVFLAEPISDSIAVLTTITLFFLHFRKLLNSKSLISSADENKS